MSRPKILINTLSLAQGGGGRSYLVNVLRELGRDARGLDVTVLADPTQLARNDAAGLDFVPLRLPAASGSARLALRVAYEQTLLPLRARAFDLLYCPADVAPAWGGTPTVVALRNMHIYDRTYYDTTRLDILGRLVKGGLRRVDRAVFPTRAAADKIASCFPVPADRVSIVPHGVAAEAFDGGGEPDPGRPRYVFLASSIERHKRIDILVRGFAEVNDPELQLWICGDDEVDPEYTELVRGLAHELGLGERFQLKGRVPYREILGYYRGSLALAFTSLLETFGHPMLEAMLAKTPIVAADIPSFREIAGDIALYFPPDDPTGLARAIEAVLANPTAAEERTARGHAHALEFSWQRSVDALCQVFHEVLAEG